MGLPARSAHHLVAGLTDPRPRRQPPPRRRRRQECSRGLSVRPVGGRAPHRRPVGRRDHPRPDRPNGSGWYDWCFRPPRASARGRHCRVVSSWTCYVGASAFRTAVASGPPTTLLCSVRRVSRTHSGIRTGPPGSSGSRRERDLARVVTLPCPARCSAPPRGGVPAAPPPLLPVQRLPGVSELW